MKNLEQLNNNNMNMITNNNNMNMITNNNISNNNSNRADISN